MKKLLTSNDATPRLFILDIVYRHILLCVLDIKSLTWRSRKESVHIRNFIFNIDTAAAAFL